MRCAWQGIPDRARTLWLPMTNHLQKHRRVLSENPLPPDVADALADRVFAVVGSDPTQSFESLQDAVLMALRQIGGAVERRGLEARVTRDALVEIEGEIYARLSQPSAV